MRLVMGGESLLGPMTGIGQYTFNLARAMLDNQDLEDFQLLVHGFLRDPEALINQCSNLKKENERTGNANLGAIIGRARSRVSQVGPAVILYEKAIRLMERLAMRGYSGGDVFHSPNYMLPDFSGRRVVSILDLSTYRYPDHHPEARVRFINKHIEQSIRHADQIITISNVIKDEIIERFHYPEKRISVTYLGADDAFFPHSEEQFQTLGHSLRLSYNNYFLSVSSIEPRKNLDRLLDAYLAYRASCSSDPLPLIVIGMPGWKSEDTHNRLQELEAKGKVRYLGYIHYKLLPALVAGARALVYPSLYEGFGLPVLEAMQSGTAVITTENTAMSEIGGSSVMQINSSKIDDLAEALTTLTSDLGKGKALEKKGMQKALKYSWKNCANQTLEAYRVAAQ